MYLGIVGVSATIEYGPAVVHTVGTYGPAIIDGVKQGVTSAVEWGIGAVNTYTPILRDQAMQATERIFGSSVTKASSGSKRSSKSGGSSSTSGSNNNWNHKDKFLSMVKNSALANAISELYRKTANVGDGGTAAKLINEFVSGEPLEHLQKSQDMVKYMQRILTEQSLTPEEVKLAHKILLREFPEVKSRITETLDMFGEDEIPKYILYEQGLNKLIHEVLLDNNDKAIIEKIFNYLEEMAVSKDVEVNNLLKVGILEYILSEEEIRGIAISYMGINTKNILNSIKM